MSRNNNTIALKNHFITLLSSKEVLNPKTGKTPFFKEKNSRRQFNFT